MKTIFTKVDHLAFAIGFMLLLLGFGALFTDGFTEVKSTFDEIDQMIKLENSRVTPDHALISKHLYDRDKVAARETSIGKLLHTISSTPSLSESPWRIQYLLPYAFLYILFLLPFGWAQNRYGIKFNHFASGFLLVFSLTLLSLFCAQFVPLHLFGFGIYLWILTIGIVIRCAIGKWEWLMPLLIAELFFKTGLIVFSVELILQGNLASKSFEVFLFYAGIAVILFVVTKLLNRYLNHHDSWICKFWDRHIFTLWMMAGISFLISFIHLHLGSEMGNAMLENGLLPCWSMNLKKWLWTLGFMSLGLSLSFNDIRKVFSYRKLV